MASRDRRRFLAALALTSFFALPALAEPPDQAAGARHLFDQGRALLAEKAYDKACAKFEESQRLDPGGGTLLNLALCNELRGKTATAWAQFGEALSWARRDGRADREAFATEHRAALGPRLTRLAVVLESGARVPGLEVSRDGLPLGEASLGEALPVDPGEHRIEARAPGHKSFSKTVKLRDGAISTLTIPALIAERGPKRDVAGSAQARPGSRRSDGARTWGTLMIGAGASATVAGLWLGWRAIEHRKDADALCPERECSSRTAVDLNDDARRSALASTLLIAGGLGLAGVGTYVMVSADPEQGSARFMLGGRL